MYGQLYGAFGRPNSNYDGYPGVYYDDDGRFYGYANYGHLADITAISTIRTTEAMAIPYYATPVAMGTATGDTAAMVAMADYGYGLYGGLLGGMFGFGCGFPYYGLYGWGYPYWMADMAAGADTAWAMADSATADSATAATAMADSARAVSARQVRFWRSGFGGFGLGYPFGFGFGYPFGFGLGFGYPFFGGFGFGFPFFGGFGYGGFG